MKIEMQRLERSMHWFLKPIGAWRPVVTFKNDNIIIQVPANSGYFNDRIPEFEKHIGTKVEVDRCFIDETIFF